MRGSKLGLLAAVTLVAGMAGCALPEVLPLAGGSTQGPSPYGVWYEQHWATNSVLLAAADQPEGSETPSAEETLAPQDETAIPTERESAEALGGEPSLDAPDAPVEASAANVKNSADFTNSTPYQFPASSYAPGARVPADDAAPTKKTAPASGAPIRY